MGTWGGWVDRLEKFLEVYEEKPDDAKDKRSVADTEQVPVQCDFKMAPNGPPEGQMCKVLSKDFLKDPCTKANHYGFNTGSPCILLKLNKIFGWVPQPYKNVTKLPENAPSKLKEFITKWESENADNVGKMIWLSCEGENPADVENVGEINYFPYPGIPNYYFPYKNQKDYRSPVVFAHLVAPKQGVLIAIECKAWANNIKHDETKMERIGSVHFELLID